jgi:hypothetical protein
MFDTWRANHRGPSDKKRVAPAPLCGSGLRNRLFQVWRPGARWIALLDRTRDPRGRAGSHLQERENGALREEREGTVEWRVETRRWEAAKWRDGATA